MNKLEIASLHPEKRIKFNSVYSEFKEYHYSSGELKRGLLNKLDSPKTTYELSIEFERSQARICDVLMELKKENKINDFRVYSKNFWIQNNRNIVVISKTKKKYLELMDEGLRKTYQFSNALKVNPKSSLKRLNELRELRLIKRDKHKNWSIIENKMVRVLGIDEAGSLV